MARIKFGRRTYHVPGPKPLRIAAGVTLVMLGMLGFLPVLGFWMIPLGLLILSVDSFRIRRIRRRLEVWWGRRSEGRNGASGKTRDDHIVGNCRIPPR